MNEPKTIEQTMEAKEELRVSIAKLIGQFEQEYFGVYIDRIDIDRIDAWGSKAAEFILNVELRVR